MFKREPQAFALEGANVYVDIKQVGSEPLPPMNDDDISGAWASDTIVYKADRVYDPVTMEAFEALTEISAEQNTIRPSKAIESLDNDVAARWFYLGKVNRHRFVDGLVYTKTVCDSPFNARVHIDNGTCNGVFLAGLVGVKTATIAVRASDGTLVETINATLTFDAPHSDDLLPHWQAAHTAVTDPIYDVTLEAENPGDEVQLGLFLGVHSTELGETQPPIQHEIDDYSRVEFDQEYGNSRFVKRGFSRRASGTVSIEGRQGGWVATQLINARGTPQVWDFNNGDESELGRVIYGVLQGAPWTDAAIDGNDTISLEIKGLVEVGNELNQDFATAFYRSLTSVNIRVDTVASDVSVLQTKITSGISNLLTDSYLVEHFLDTVPDPDIRKWSHWTRLSADGEYATPMVPMASPVWMITVLGSRIRPLTT
ncbi:MAG: hypothetical protein GVY22_02230 [Gammaproteobacteria bacterium]|jgi:hypothetical protein|nr:hypothetical protein [Gammaproteobacteria bacterium]